MVDFPGCPVSMAVAWSVIDGIVHGPDLLLADSGEAGALGETLTNQPVGVPVAAAPPWMEGQGEAEHRAGGLYDLLEVSELHTPVQGHGPALRMPSERADPHIGNVASGMRGACLCSMVLRPVERLVFSPKER